MVLTILGLSSRIQVWYCLHDCFFLIYLPPSFKVVYFPHFSASVHPLITDEQEAFIRWVLKFAFDEWRCRDLITLDTLHTYYGGPEPTPASCRLNTYSDGRKFVHLRPFLLPFLASAYLSPSLFLCKNGGSQEKSLSVGSCC